MFFFSFSILILIVFFLAGSSHPPLGKPIYPPAPSASASSRHDKHQRHDARPPSSSSSSRSSSQLPPGVDRHNDARHKEQQRRDVKEAKEREYAQQQREAAQREQMQRNAMMGAAGFNPAMPHPFNNPQGQSFSNMGIAPPPYPGQKPPPLSTLKPSMTEKSIFDLSPEKPARPPSYPDPSAITSLPGPPNLSGHTSLPGPPNLSGHTSLPGPPSLPAPPRYQDMNPPLPPPKSDPPPPAYPKTASMGGFSQLPVTEQDLARNRELNRSLGLDSAVSDNFGLIKPSPILPSSQSFNQMAGGQSTGDQSIDSLFGFSTSAADIKQESDLQKSLFDPEFAEDFELPKSEEVSDFSDLFDTSSLATRFNKKDKVNR